MASTITLTGDWLVSLGNRRQTSGTGNLGTSYASGGIAVSANQVGLGTIQSMVVDPAGGYTFEWVASTGKVKAYLGSGALSAHTHDFIVIGGQAASTTNDVATYATSILGKQEAANVTVAGVDSATKGGIVAVSAGSAAASTEVTATTNLSGITFNFRAVGI